jgi:hypothetical protein
MLFAMVMLFSILSGSFICGSTYDLPHRNNRLYGGIFKSPELSLAIHKADGLDNIPPHTLIVEDNKLLILNIHHPRKNQKSFDIQLNIHQMGMLNSFLNISTVYFHVDTTTLKYARDGSVYSESEKENFIYSGSIALATDDAHKKALCEAYRFKQDKENNMTDIERQNKKIKHLTKQNERLTKEVEQVSEKVKNRGLKSPRFALLF